jgi:dephospho-CoA kinase
LYKNIRLGDFMTENIVVGIVGMPGSGKSVLAEMFSNTGWGKCYFGSVTLKELDRRQLPYNEKNEKHIREGLRAKYGEDAYAKLLLPEIMEFAEAGPVIIDGLYSWSEYLYLKENLQSRLKILAVVTNSQNRYDRLVNREHHPLTQEQAISRDHAEIEKLSKGGPIAIADYYIMNNGTLDEYNQKFRALLIKENWLLND